MTSTYLSLLIPSAILFPLLLLSWKKHALISIQTIPIFFVFTCFLFAPFSLVIRPVEFTIPTIAPMFYLGISWLLWLAPLLFIKKINNPKQDYGISETNFTKIVCFVAVLTMIPFLLFLKYSKNIISSDIDLLRTGGGWSISIIDSIGIQLCCFFPMTLFLLGPCVFLYKTQTWEKVFLFLGSFCEPLHVLIFFGRDGFIQWFFLAFLTFGLYYQYIDKRKLRKVVLNVFIFILVPFLIANALISSSRTRTSIADSFLSLTVDYFIQTPKNFVAVYDIDNIFSYKPSHKIFQFLKKFDSHYDAEEDRLLSNDFRAFFRQQYGYDKNVFSTFVGSLCQSFGKQMTMMISITASILLSFAFSHLGKSIGYFYFAFFYCFSIMLNFFYLKYAMSTQPWIMVLIALLFLFYSYHIKESQVLAPVSPQPSGIQ